VFCALARCGTQSVIFRELGKLDSQSVNLNDALLISASRGYEAVMRLPLDKGLDAKAGGDDGLTTLYRAADTPGLGTLRTT
jgi:hypothetical protein